MKLLFATMLLATLLLSTSFLQATLAQSNDGSGKIDCGSKCDERCSKAGREKMCLKDCIACCNTCNCVPPGTYGNKEACPCYANLLDQENHKPKCP